VETLAFCLRLRPGMEEEYRRRHDALWPAMREALLGAGILHYEIYLDPDTRILFAHQIRRPGQGPTPEGEAVLARWRAFMADVLEMEGDRPVRRELVRQFRLVAGDASRSPQSGKDSR
jgi:L-rhamnose mutarotase